MEELKSYGKFINEGRITVSDIVKLHEDHCEDIDGIINDCQILIGDMSGKFQTREVTLYKKKLDKLRIALNEFKICLD